jgi:hypothetical protein
MKQTMLSGEKNNNTIIERVMFHTTEKLRFPNAANKC